MSAKSFTLSSTNNLTSAKMAPLQHSPQARQSSWPVNSSERNSCELSNEQHRKLTMRKGSSVECREESRNDSVQKEVAEGTEREITGKGKGRVSSVDPLGETGCTLFGSGYGALGQTHPTTFLLLALPRFGKFGR